MVPSEKKKWNLSLYPSWKWEKNMSGRCSPNTEYCFLYICNLKRKYRVWVSCTRMKKPYLHLEYSRENMPNSFWFRKSYLAGQQIQTFLPCLPSPWIHLSLREREILAHVESSPPDHHVSSLSPEGLPDIFLCTSSLPTKSIFHIAGQS